ITGDAGNQNQLFGDFYYIHPAEHYAQGESLVHVQAFDGVGDGGAWQEGDLTFYGRYVNGGAVDNREPLPSVFGARYLGDFGSGGGTDLIVWRDTNSPSTSGVACGDQPEWWPLRETSIFDFDEEENAVQVCFSPFGQNAPALKLTPPPPPGTFECLKIATQRIGTAGDTDSGGSPIGVNDSGWLRLDLNNYDVASQAWVVSLMSNSGQYSIGLSAAGLHSPCDGVPEGFFGW
ncbi:MAG: hypothetical protein AAFY88_19965, partial [Acidobacteriota bacterium]